MGTHQQPSQAWATYEALTALRWNHGRRDASATPVTRPTKAAATTARRRRHHGVRTLLHRMLASTPG